MKPVVEASVDAAWTAAIEAAKHLRGEDYLAFLDALVVRLEGDRDLRKSRQREPVVEEGPIDPAFPVAD